MTKSIYDNFGVLITISFFSTISLGFGLFWVTVFNDYILYELYQLQSLLVTEGILGYTWVGTLIDGFATDVILAIPTILDILWVGLFLSLVVEMVTVSYKMKRESYFSALSFLFWGILVVLFVMGIFLQFSSWLNVEVFNAMNPNLSAATPFFTFYLAWAGLINAVIIVICVLVNIFDFNLAAYNARKRNEGDGQTLQEIN